jgi:hypothetical protein
VRQDALALADQGGDLADAPDARRFANGLDVNVVLDRASKNTVRVLGHRWVGCRPHLLDDDQSRDARSNAARRGWHGALCVETTRPLFASNTRAAEKPLRDSNRHAERIFNPARKDTHWGRRKLNRHQLRSTSFT